MTDLDPDAEQPGEPEPRRYPSTIGGIFYLIVLAATLTGVVVVAAGSWRAGVRWIGGAAVFAACIRLILRDDSAGMLKVRHKVTDAAGLAIVGGVLIFLAGTIPDQPGL